ncbi:glycine zipper family protein [Acidovorax sp.]|uniref:glycine zipper family protein n=1 Tax=Acidovorax sp. TaxID=1872122 RepID=UPI0025860534|nr:glycine zipper family protein [Acidovorax sp.]
MPSPPRTLTFTYDMTPMHRPRTTAAIAAVMGRGPRQEGGRRALPALPQRLCAGLLALVLAGCAAHSPDLPAQRAPDDSASARYGADLDYCRQHAAQVGVVAETLDGLVQGALVTAALVWGLGYGHDTVRDWAAVGGVLGATQGLQALERRRQTEAACMATRGHGPVAAAPQPAPPRPAPALALPRQIGTDAFSAERLARSQSCSEQPLASLAAKGPGFETYSVACTNGDALAIRCEFGNCRVLR